MKARNLGTSSVSERHPSEEAPCWSSVADDGMTSGGTTTSSVPRWSSIMKKDTLSNETETVEVPCWASVERQWNTSPRVEPMYGQSGTAGPTPGSAGPTSEQQDLITVESGDGIKEEYIVKSEVASSGDEAEAPPFQQLSQGNAMAAAAIPVGDGVTDSDSLFTRDELRVIQQKDDGIRISMEYCQKGVPPDHTEMTAIPEDAKGLLLQFESLQVRDGILYRRFQHSDSTTQYWQLVLPVSLRREYIERIHADLGHFGQTKTCEAFARRSYFPGWRPYVKSVVRNRTICNKSQRSRQTPKQTVLRPMREFRPMAVLHADLAGPIPAGRNQKGQHGFQYILSVVDSATRYLWLIPLRNKTAETVANTLYEDVIARTSVPSAVLTDLGKEFTAEILERLCEHLGIKRLRTSGYHPQCDSKCERAHYSVHNMMVKYIEKDFARRPSLLMGICLAYNSTVHTSTGFAPHELFYSFPPSCLFDIIVEADRTKAADNADQYALEATDRLKQAFQFVYEFTGRVTEKMKSNYDASIKEKSFEVGTFVLVYTPPKQQQRQVHGKWKVPWQGPYKVKLNSTNYVVKRSSRAKDFVEHGDRVKLYHGEIDASAWPADRQDGQQLSPASAGIASTGDPDPVSQQAPARLGSAQTGIQRQRGGSNRSHDGAGQPACSTFHPGPVHTGHSVPPATGINYDQQLAGPISDGEFSASRPKRRVPSPSRHDC